MQQGTCKGGRTLRKLRSICTVYMLRANLCWVQPPWVHTIQPATPIITSAEDNPRSCQAVPVCSREASWKRGSPEQLDASPSNCRWTAAGLILSGPDWAKDPGWRRELRLPQSLVPPVASTCTVDRHSLGKEKILTQEIRARECSEGDSGTS